MARYDFERSEYGGHRAGADYGVETRPDWSAYGYGLRGPTPGGYSAPGDFTGQRGFTAVGHRVDYRQATFAGRGPRNYRRSDDRIRDDVCDTLSRHPAIDASDIDVRVENGEVILTGTAEDRYTKRLAEDVSERVSGVTDVRNEVKVRRGARERHTGDADAPNSEPLRPGEESTWPQAGVEVRRATRRSTIPAATRT